MQAGAEGVGVGEQELAVEVERGEGAGEPGQEEGEGEADYGKVGVEFHGRARRGVGRDVEIQADSRRS